MDKPIQHNLTILTSIILTATTSVVYSEPFKTISFPDNNLYYLGSHGESGESGEGGFEARTLETDNTAFGSALMVIQAHYAIGRKLYEAKKYEQATAFFGHPISEVLVELEPAFKARKISSISDQMYHLLEIAEQPNLLNEINQGVQNISAMISNIFLEFQKKNPTEYLKMIANINADMIRRSKLEYITALEKNDLGHLQDSIGYYDIAYMMYQNNRSLYLSENPKKVQDIENLFQEIQPYFTNFETIDKNVNSAKLAGLTAKIELLLSNL